MPLSQRRDTTSEKFEKAALFLPRFIGQPSALIRHENSDALQTGDI